MKIIHLTVALLFITTGLRSQSATDYWKVASKDIVEAKIVATFILDLNRLQAKLSITEKDAAPIFIAFPLPDGTFKNLQMEETAVMAPALAARYPSIRTFRAFDKNDVSIRATFDVSATSFHAVVEQKGRTIFIAPSPNTIAEYVSYYADEYPTLFNTNCGVSSDEKDASLPTPLPEKRDPNLPLRRYRLAIACTGEFAQQFGGTVESALAAIVTAVNQLNHIYERELGITFQLIADNDRLIFTDPQTDPFLNAGKVLELLEESRFIFRDSLNLPDSAYDIGHIFTAGCTGADGVAHTSGVCRVTKAGGITCFNTTNIEAIVAIILAHEVGHQFSARHTFNGICNSSQVTVGSDVEPFCGHTIMSYNTTDKLPYFHAVSLASMNHFIKIVEATGCGSLIETDNHAPEITLLSPSNVAIPTQTPFELRATATDVDGDLLTYSWEQCDAGTGFYRSYAPVITGNLMFPALPDLLSNTMSALPTTSRDFTFRCTVRDNHAGRGAINQQEVKFQTSATAGPFRVIYPNNDTVVWQAGNQVEVRWAVAGTDKNSINCKSVRIRLSMDGGYTYPIILLQNAANNGFAIVSIPSVVTDKARIRVEANENIFFDISNHNFTIKAPAKPTFTISATPLSIRTFECTTKPIEYEIFIDTIFGYDKTLTLQLIGNLPEGTSVTFSKQQFKAPANILVRILFQQAVQDSFKLQIVATDSDQETKHWAVQFNTITPYLNAIRMIQPENGQSITNPLYITFVWNTHPTLQQYDFELATSPTFGEATIIRTIVEGSYYATTSLTAYNRLYYWRVRPKDNCTSNGFLEPFIFKLDYECKQIESTDTPHIIPKTANTATYSNIQFEGNTNVRAIRIPNMRLQYQPIHNLQISLFNPQGKKILLYDANCADTTTVGMDIGFSVAGTYERCPPDSGKIIAPVEKLTDFHGRPLRGTWGLGVQTIRPTAEPGLLESWSLEICTNVLRQNPFVIKNDTLIVRYGKTAIYTKNQLEVGDNDNNASQLKYILLTLPQHGSLTRSGVVLKVGDTFTQQEVTNFQLQYTHKGNNATSDSFSFVVEDGTGGWLSTKRAPIKIDVNATVDVNDILEDNAISVFPNPTQNLLNVQFEKAPKGSLTASLYNVQGQEVRRERFENAGNLLQINTSNLASGMYFLTVRTAEGIATKKVSVQR